MVVKKCDTSANLEEVEKGIEAVGRGEFVILFDEEREHEGDLVLAAEAVTPQRLNFMLRRARGILCVPMTAETLDRLKIPLMTPNGQGPCKFTVSVDARYGITTGSSVHDRAHTIKLLIDPRSRPEDFVQPGHVFPLRAHEGGLQARGGHTEGSIEIVRAAGLFPAAVICEILSPDGGMASFKEIKRFARRHSLITVSLSALKKYLYGR